VLKYLAAFRRALSSVEELCEACTDAGIGFGGLSFPEDLLKEERQLADLVEGMSIAWTAHYRQRAFDEIIGEAVEKSRIQCPKCRRGLLDYAANGPARVFRCAECGVRVAELAIAWRSIRRTERPLAD